MMFSVLLDSLYFGKLVSTHFNFINFNVLQGGSGDYFGRRPVAEYLVYMALITGPIFPFVFLGLYKDLKIHIQKKIFPLLFSVF